MSRNSRRDDRAIPNMRESLCVAYVSISVQMHRSKPVQRRVLFDWRRAQPVRATAHPNNVVEKLECTYRMWALYASVGTSSGRDVCMYNALGMSCRRTNKIFSLDCSKPISPYHGQTNKQHSECSPSRRSLQTRQTTPQLPLNSLRMCLPIQLIICVLIRDEPT